MYNIYLEHGIGKTVFIKISDSYGLRIGKIVYKFLLGSDEEEVPHWLPAVTGERGNSFTLFRVKEFGTAFTKASKVSDKIVKRLKIDKFINDDIMQTCIKLAINDENLV